MDTATPIHTARPDDRAPRRPRRTTPPRSWEACTAMASSASRARSPRVGAATPAGRRRCVPGCAGAARRDGGQRTPSLLRRDPSRRHPRLHRSRHAFLGHRGMRGRARPRLQDRRARLRRADPRRAGPAVAPRFPRPAGHAGRPAPQLAGVQPDVRGRVSGDGAVRDRTRHAVGRPHRLRARDVPAEVPLSAISAARTAEDAADGRHLGALGPDDPPGHANRSDKPRPVLVLGVDAPTANNAERHDVQFTKDYATPHCQRSSAATSRAASSNGWSRSSRRTASRD